MSSGDWIQLIAVIVALVGVAVSFIMSYRGQKHERERTEQAQVAAEASAERAERSAALTIDTLADIVEAIRNISITSSGQVELYEGVKWAMSFYGGDTYQIDNIGNATAYNTTIESDPSLALFGSELSDVIGPGEAANFMAARTMNTRDSTITVKWCSEPESGAEPNIWRYPLPPKS